MYQGRENSTLKVKNVISARSRTVQHSCVSAVAFSGREKRQIALGAEKLRLD